MVQLRIRAVSKRASLTHAQDYSTVTFGAKPGARPNSARPGGTSQRSGGGGNSMTTGSGISAAKLDGETEELKRASLP